MSHLSQQPQTASEYIDSQLRLEEDAREVLPYQFDTCTKQFGPLRQSVFACLTCTPPPASPHQQFSPAGICYSCSISCHGEHNLAELFTKRNVECDCGTTRYANSRTPCSLRLNASTGRKGGVVDEEPRAENKYDQNYVGKFCGCGEGYDPEKEKGTMFQCLGLGSAEDGGCGEDWWHPECLMGIPRQSQHGIARENEGLETVEEESEAAQSIAPNSTRQQESENAAQKGDLDNTSDAVREEARKEDPSPPGFPDEDEFDHLICYRCVSANPWIKQYAGAAGFLSALPHNTELSNGSDVEQAVHTEADSSRKRKTDDDHDEAPLKREKLYDGSQDPANQDETAPSTKLDGVTALHETLAPSTHGEISLLLKDDFRDHFCRCASCFPRLAKFPQLLEEEESYEPPLSESDDEEEVQSIAGRSVNSGSLLERGEAALSSMDRVRAIEGVMAYNHVRDKVKEFLAPFAESGKVVGAEDIKAYFAQLRGDEQQS